MKRQFVNLVTDNYMKGKGYCSLIRINSASLFNRIKQNGGTESKTVVEEAVLPKPSLLFSRSCPSDFGRSMRFMSFGRSMDKIVRLKQDDSVLVYDAYQKMVLAMPNLNGRMRNPIPFAVGDNALYIIETCPDATYRSYHNCFQALIHGKSSDDVNARPDWQWHSLPLPPYVEAPGYKPSSSSKISSFVVAGENIWISARGIGTYSFNTTRHQWSKAGSWELPFSGRAEYVPNHNLLFGFSSGEKQLLFCAADLAAPAAVNALPSCRVWEELAAPKDWKLLSSHLVHLDSTRFCIAKFYQVYAGDVDQDDPVPTDWFVVFTGLEVDPCSNADGELHMIKHRSIRYNFDNNLIHWVL